MSGPRLLGYKVIGERNIAIFGTELSLKIRILKGIGWKEKLRAFFGRRVFLGKYIEEDSFLPADYYLFYCDRHGFYPAVPLALHVRPQCTSCRVEAYMKEGFRERGSHPSRPTAS